MPPARVREKQKRATQPVVVQAGAEPDNSAMIAAREARKAEARARQAERAQQPAAETTAESVDPRKAAVEAAIARASA